MRRSTHKRRTPARGFTMLEMMAVLMIIALIGSIVGIAIIKQIEKARVKTAKTQIAGFDNALKMFNLEYSRYPTEEEGLQILVEEGFLDATEVPKDPWGAEYEYRVRTGEKGEDCIVICYGSDKNVGGTGNAADLCSKSQNIEDWLAGG